MNGYEPSTPSVGGISPFWFLVAAVLILLFFLAGKALNPKKPATEKKRGGFPWELLIDGIIAIIAVAIVVGGPIVAGLVIVGMIAIAIAIARGKRRRQQNEKARHQIPLGEKKKSRPWWAPAEKSKFCVCCQEKTDILVNINRNWVDKGTVVWQEGKVCIPCFRRLEEDYKKAGGKPQPQRRQQAAPTAHKVHWNEHPSGAASHRKTQDAKNQCGSCGFWLPWLVPTLDGDKFVCRECLTELTGMTGEELRDYCRQNRTYNT